MESIGLKAAKIWAFTPSIYSNSGTNLISFTDKKKSSPNGKIDWGYHVAPILQVKIGNKHQKMVIDPGLFPEGLVSYRTWLAKLKTPSLIYLIMDSEWYLFNSRIIQNSEPQFWQENSIDSLKPNLVLPEWFSDKLITDFFKYEEDSKDNHWLEKGMAINETAIQFYNAEIKPILNLKLQNELLKEYRDLAGNVFNFETVFRDNMWNYEMTTEFQQKHHKVIAKYRKIYESELVKWQLIIKDLV